MRPRRRPAPERVARRELARSPRRRRRRTPCRPSPARSRRSPRPRASGCRSRRTPSRRRRRASHAGSRARWRAPTGCCACPRSRPWRRRSGTPPASTRPSAAPPHWRSTSCICVRSTTPVTGTTPRPTTSASAPRIGPEVSTGEQIRMRSRAHAMRLPISAASSGPRPGQKNGRTRTGCPANVASDHSESKRPLLSRWRGRFQRSSKSRR